MKNELIKYEEVKVKERLLPSIGQYYVIPDKDGFYGRVYRIDEISINKDCCIGSVGPLDEYGSRCRYKLSFDNLDKWISFIPPKKSLLEYFLDPFSKNY